MLAERVKQWTEEWKRETQRAIARAPLDIIPDDALLAERTGVPVAEITAMRQETPWHN